jgi:hypothetical protein
MLGHGLCACDEGSGGYELCRGQVIDTCYAGLNCARSLASVSNVINEISLPLYA